MYNTSKALSVDRSLLHAINDYLSPVLSSSYPKEEEVETLIKNRETVIDLISVLDDRLGQAIIGALTDEHEKLLSEISEST